MKALKGAEEMILVGWIETRAVVADKISRRSVPLGFT